MKKMIILLVVICSVCFLGYSQKSEPTIKTQIFFDDFESYNVNEKLVCQNPEDWTTWDNLPCTYQDPYITDSIAYSGSKSVILVDSNDLVKPIDNYTEGRYRINFKMFIPEGSYGYFVTLQKFEGLNSNWGMQVLFHDEGLAHILCPSATFFNYSYNTWFSNDIIIDLDHDFAKYFHNNILIEEWCWSYGGGWSGINQLAGSEFYPWTNVPQGVGKYYIDDYQIEELKPFQLLPPENLTLETSGSDNVLHWDSPFQEFWLHYDGENYGNGIGPSPVYIAARFLPEDIQALDGMYLTKIKFFARNSDCYYSLRVWTGENAGNLILEQDVLEFIPDSWNEVELNNPVLIDASQELWLGNICSSINAWDYPAACDEGPALPYLGDLLSFDGINWVSMSLDFGLDYNWNIRGFVSSILGNSETTKTISKNSSPSTLLNNNLNYNNKGLLGYNIYGSFNYSLFNFIGFTEDTIFIDPGYGTGNYEYFVTALYDEGESITSDTVSAFMTTIVENKIYIIQISPNPTRDLIKIRSSKNIKKIAIMNLSGQILKYYQGVDKQSFNLSVREYDTGIYLIRMDIGNKQFFRKIIIQ